MTILKTTRENGTVGVGRVFIINPDDYRATFMTRRSDDLYEWDFEDIEAVMKTDVTEKWNTDDPVETGLYEAVEGKTDVWRLVGEL